MAFKIESPVGRVFRAMRDATARIEILALFPLLTLLAVGYGQVDIALATSLILPALLALQAVAGAPVHRAGLRLGGSVAGTSSRLDGAEALLSALEQSALRPQQDTACILVQIDGWDSLVDRWGGEGAHDIADRVFERLQTSLRNGDTVTRLGDARFGIVLHPMPAARLGVRETIVNRLRGAMAEPVAVAGTAARVTISTGHSNLIRDAVDPAKATFAAAETALAEAHRDGPDTVRAYAPGLGQSRKSRHALACEVDAALAAGDIRPWFQPQLRCDTGTLSGFEALARWHHPERGIIQPAEFLPAVADAGRMEALGHAILFHALNALRTWDASGLRVPSVAINFSAAELRSPGLVDRVKWEIDRFELRPGRLTVEILETVAAKSQDDSVIATIHALGAHGVNLDLDDFGIGQASLSAIRRFGVSRIKIDRSFVTGLDTDPEQHSMVSAILAMAKHLGVETLAEGVETEIVQARLAQMGCTHVQGYLIARPMPFEDTIAWATAHNAAIATQPARSRRAG